jgi:DNA recombination protein RmuC
LVPVSLEILLGVATALLLGLCLVVGLSLALQLRTARRLGDVAGRLAELDRLTERSERAVREELQKSREEAGGAGKLLREEVSASIQGLGEGLGKGLAELRGAVDAHLDKLREDNTRKLDEMRRIVDEKLQGTLEKRLGDAFRQVSERLEAVHKGLGEMQSLAVGVGDLKKVLTNVRTRGSFGELQLGTLLEQILSPGQYASQVATRPGGSERVDFAIRLPGAEGDADTPVWLPIDAKFPQDDFERLVDAHENGDAAGAAEAVRALEARIRSEARSIREKYVCPPHTTDFALLFLPTEALYAEVLRRPGLVEWLHRECRVSVTGPTTLAALLNSLQLGFRTLAIQKRSDEVWQLLGAVRTQFGKFGDLLEKVDKKLHEASTTIGQATRKTRYIEKRLGRVEALPEPECRGLLPELAGEEPAGEDA